MNLTSMKRWIVASIHKQLLLKTQGLPLIREGEDHLAREKNKFVELRIDGPYSKPCGTAGEYLITVEVNLLARSTREESNIYDKENLHGIVIEMLNQDFCIYRIGNTTKETVDDSSFVGTMSLIPHDRIMLSDFGRIEDSAEIYEAVSEAHYEMYI